MKIIQLTQGQVARVSDDWYEKLNKDKWYAKYNSNTKSYYAMRHSSKLIGKQKTILMHRVVANTPDGMQTDHIDHDTLNNQVENLRTCTPSQNQYNRGKTANNASGFKGVSAHGNNWRIHIRVNGKQINLGTYPTREEAARVYDEAAKKYHGRFAQLNEDV